jgi:hypothetical protein
LYIVLCLRVINICIVIIRAAIATGLLKQECYQRFYRYFPVT